MSSERDYISEYFEAKGVSRGEFEALKRFGDYEELSDGTLNANGRRQGVPHLLRSLEPAPWP
jgi:hypothetical protein